MLTSLLQKIDTERFAAKCLEFIESGDSIILDSGSTTTSNRLPCPSPDTIKERLILHFLRQRLLLALPADDNILYGVSM